MKPKTEFNKIWDVVKTWLNRILKLFKLKYFKCNVPILETVPAIRNSLCVQNAVYVLDAPCSSRLEQFLVMFLIVLLSDVFLSVFVCVFKQIWRFLIKHGFTVTQTFDITITCGIIITCGIDLDSVEAATIITRRSGKKICKYNRFMCIFLLYKNIQSSND